MRKILFIFFLAGYSHALTAQTPVLERVEPPFWWVGMKDSTLQLMVYGKQIAQTTVSVQHPAVKLLNVHKAESPDYIFIDLVIKPNTAPAHVAIDFVPSKGKKKISYDYELKARSNDLHAGLDGGDVIYLITPDRFANGDVSNDSIKGLKDGKNRSVDYGRHGGDLQGILSKTAYMKDLGITAVWLNPVLENAMPEYSYHGYATTDYYKVDPRFGSNELYRKLADDLHQKNMKIIMDMVFNHCGLEHRWMKNKPFGDWVHEYQITNHAISAISDPHAVVSDQQQMEQGWFVSQMPDLNQDNPFMARYLIQNSIWWIEYAGLDGIRMDTYPYNKKEFMASWGKQVLREYPHFYLVGETWVDNEAQEAFWAAQKEVNDHYNSNLNSITDFPLCFSMHKCFKEKGDLAELYRVLGKDFLYSNPYRNKIFADNHDMDRFYYTIGQDLSKFKLAMTFLLTTRGIPQLYYGTELLMHGHGPHGVIREDFPGGWPGDTHNAFTTQGRSTAEKEAFDFVSRLLNWRKNSDAIHRGELKHFIPYDNIYVYNRRSEKESILVVMNNNADSRKVDLKRFAEVLNGYKSASDVLNGQLIESLDTLEIPANTARVLKLNPSTGNSD